MGRRSRSVTMAGVVVLALSAHGCNEVPVQIPLRDLSSPSTPAVRAPLATAIRLDLGTLGGAHSYATDVNDLGSVVGWSETATGVSRAFRWTRAEGMTDLGTLPGDQWSRAVSISNAGHILGVSGATGDFNGTPVAWPPAGGPTPLPIPLLPGAVATLLADHNDLGRVTGSSLGGTLPSHAWVWSRRPGIYDITAHIPGGGFESYGSQINGAGLVVGTNHATVCTQTAECWHAFAWSSRTGYRDLGIPVGSDLSSAQVTGAALNDAGVVVGWTSPGVQPFRWSPRGGFTVLPTFSPAPAPYGYAQSVNSVGTVVGASEDAEGGAILAAAWPVSGGIVRLSTDDPNPSVAMAVNRFGVVVGWSSLDCCGAVNHATLWALGPGAGMTAAAAPPQPAPGGLTAPRTPARTATAGPVGCLSDPRAVLSRQLLVACVARRPQ